MASTAPLVNR
jgi:hypothetical protein